MIRPQILAAFVAGAVFAAVPTLLIAQNAVAPAPKPAMAEVGIFHVAPGKQIDFLKWQAAQDAAVKDAGLPATQWYAHVEGDSWDYLAVGPHMSDADAAKVDAAAKKRGIKTGPQAGIEFRKLIASHTDTLVVGPTTAQQILDAVK